MENKAICWRNCHCDCEVSPTLSTNTPVCPLPSYSPAVTSCSPDIVTVFVHKDAMVNHGIAHKQICLASPSLYHVGSIPLGWERPDQFHSEQHSLKRTCHSAVVYFRLAVYLSQC